MNNGVVIGLKDVYYALLLTDPAFGGTPTYDTPALIAGAITANIKANASNDTLFADDGPYDVASTIGAIDLELNVADLSLEQQAILLGHTKVAGVLMRKSSDIPPWVAVGFKTIKSNGHYRYTWLAKGKFLIPDQSNETKADKVNYKTPTMTGNFVKRDSDNEWERHVDEDDVDYVSTLGTEWYNGPLGGSAHTSVPTVSTIAPADASSGAAPSDVVITFSEAMKLSTITTGNIVVYNDTTKAIKAGTLAVNGAGTIVTFTPTTAFTAATWVVVVTSDIEDAYGVHKAASTITKFTVT